MYVFTTLNIDVRTGAYYLTYLLILLVIYLAW